MLQQPKNLFSMFFLPSHSAVEPLLDVLIMLFSLSFYRQSSNFKIFFLQNFYELKNIRLSMFYVSHNLLKDVKTILMELFVLFYF